MRGLLHPAHVTSLDEFRTAIEQRADDFVMETGRLLHEARDAHPAEWQHWVETELPFSTQKARQLVAIYRAFVSLPLSVTSSLPRPYQALFALRNLSLEQLRAGIDSGDIHPDTTVEESRKISRRLAESGPYKAGNAYNRSGGRSRADIRASKLLACEPEGLSDMMAGALRAWLQRRPPART